MSPRATGAVGGCATDLALAVPLARLYRSPVSHLLTYDAGRVTTLPGPLTLELVADHLAGRRDVGAIPLDVDGRAIWAALDVDTGGYETANRLRAVLGRQLGAAHLFTSSGYTHPDGYHVAVFFMGPVPEAALRAVLEAARREADVPGAEIIIAKGLRLPYWRAAPEGRRVALDAAGKPMSLTAFLAAVERVPASRILAGATRTHASLQSSCSLQASPKRAVATQGDAEIGKFTDLGIRRGARRRSPNSGARRRTTNSQAAPLQPRPAVLPAVPADLAELGLRPRLVGLIQSGRLEGSKYTSRSALQMAVFEAVARAGHRPPMAWALLEAYPRLRERTSATGQAGKDLPRSIARAWAHVAATPDTRRRRRRATSEFGREPFTMLSTTALTVLLPRRVALPVYIDVVKHVSRHTGFAEITAKGISERIGCSLASVKRGMAELRKRGLVEAVPLEKRWPTGRRVVAYRPRPHSMTHRD